MHSNCIKKLIDLEDVIVENIMHADKYVKIFIKTKPSAQVCPCCKTTTSRIHDYRLQTIKDLPFQLKHTYLILKKQRYVPKCFVL